MGPKALFIRVIMILLAVAVVVLCYYVVLYVLGLLGIHIPANILTVIIGLLLVLRGASTIGSHSNQPSTAIARGLYVEA